MEFPDLQPTKCNVSACQARCCYSVALPADMYAKFADKIVRKPMAVVRAYGDTVQPIQSSENQKFGMHACPWLTADNRCNIYEERPAICRLWEHSELSPLLGCTDLGDKEYLYDNTPVYLLTEAPDILYKVITGEDKPKMDRAMRRYFQKNKHLLIKDISKRMENG